MYVKVEIPIEPPLPPAPERKLRQNFMSTGSVVLAYIFLDLPMLDLFCFPYFSQ